MVALASNLQIARHCHGALACAGAPRPAFGACRPDAGLSLTYALNAAMQLELGLDITQVEFAGEKGQVRLLTADASLRC